MSYKITSLHVYPVKSLGGTNQQSARLSDFGFEYDRYWMLVDENHSFLTQREIPKLCLFTTEIKEDHLAISYQGDTLQIPLQLDSDIIHIKSKVWKTKVLGYKENDTICDWFSDRLGKRVSLIRHQKEQPRPISKHPDHFVHFADAHQFAIIGEESMRQLNEKSGLDQKINRFRANIIFSGGEPHIEDKWDKIKIGQNTLQSTKSISRCIMTCIEQESAQVGKEPLRTLATYRKGYFSKILFGQYYKLISQQTPEINVGEEIVIL